MLQFPCMTISIERSFRNPFFLIHFMQITIWISSITFHAYADITYQSKSDVSSKIVCNLCKSSFVNQI